ncbi:MAG TPA: LuxR C-terminal-related transcriptional regulator [Ktedonobacteraceae bacterium]|nr:LuxR C-terminal-related transcriptional regulator [Ktedonobacteraceae bacterium]
MPRGMLPLLSFSLQEQRYTLTLNSLPLSLEIISSHQAWMQWLDTISSFAFENCEGTHCTIRKERLQRGDAYWYAYRSIRGQTKKRYLGRTADLSFERLEEVSTRFPAEERGVFQFAPAAEQERIQTTTSKGSTVNRRIAPVLAPFLETKLHPPRPPAQLVERSRLLALLDSGQMQKLTLLQAPAGSGKTALVTQWIIHRQAIATRQKPESIAWISLDRGDNHPVRFWSSIIAACQVFDAQFGQRALAQISLTTQFPFPQLHLETVLTFLLNDLTHLLQQEGVLILDDYHCIEHERIHETVTFFIEHLPPRLRVILLTRSEPPLPLVRWRARGDVLEVQSNHLRFSEEETASFLQQTIPYTLSQETVRRLSLYLEGWVAGLRLFVLSIQRSLAPQIVEEVLTRLTTGARAPHLHRSIQEFFLSEVLSAQTESLQRFLLQTSVLSRLTGSLCDAITGRQDSAKWLDLACRSGFFLEALDNQGQWYRYHSLFAETLRAEAVRHLGEEVLHSLSAEASRWYEAHAMPMETIDAALLAQQFERAAHLIEEMDHAAYFAEYHTMRYWLEHLPASVLHAYPQLCFRLAQSRLFTEDIDGTPLRIEQVEELLQVAEEEWNQQEDLPHIGTLYAFRATLTARQGLFAQALAYARHALTLLPLETEPSDGAFPSSSRQQGWVDWRIGCLIAVGTGSLQAGSFDNAHQLLLEAYMRCLNNKNRVFTRPLRTMLGEVCIALGELHQAASYFQQTLTEICEQDEKGEDIIHADSLYGLARLSYEWNELERAEQLVHEASVSGYRGYFPSLEEESRTKGELLRLQVLYARGDVASARASLSALFVRLQASPTLNTRRLIPDVLFYQARFQIRDDDLSAALHTLSTLAPYEKEMSSLQVQTMQLLHARLHLAQGKITAALPSLGQLLTSAQQGKHLIRTLEIQLLITFAYFANRQEHEARQYLSEVLRGARNAGFQRLFLDEGEPLAALLRSLLPSLTEKSLRAYARSILHAFRSLLPVHVRDPQRTECPLPKLLSPQERRVLTLLVAGRSNLEIAQELIVSTNTVKVHVKNIYRKLAVTRRVEAVSVAQQEKLI